MKKLMALIAMTCLVSFGANAQSYKKPGGYYGGPNYEASTVRSARGGVMSVNVMQRQAREKIANGIVNGTITSREAKMLLEMAERIEAKENRYLRNGRLTSYERRELEEDLERLDRMIIRNKRDNEYSNADVYRGNHRRGY